MSADCVRRARRARRAVAGALAVVAAGCAAGDDGAAREAARAPGVAPAVGAPARLGVGTPVTPAQLAATDLDANADGRGLPPGSGTAARGAVVYAARCASCHGAGGEGIAPFPRLVGPPADTGFAFGRDVKLVKTPGNYWPHATTLYDYVRRAMPFDAPGSLAPDDVYALVAFILAENRVIAPDAVMDARSLPAVRMPARGRFVRDDRAGGPTFR